ncbi:hypothetical protein [Rhodocaloribacter sp.]
MGLKEVFLKKGWAGRTISREETVERLNPLIRQLTELMYDYRYVVEHLSERAVAAALDAALKTLRADIGKLSETVLSNGGVAYNGTDLDPAAFDLGSDDDEMLFNLLDAEQAFQERIAAEKEVEHQMRTRAILGVVAQNSRDRLVLLRTHTSRRRRKAKAQIGTADAS